MTDHLNFKIKQPTAAKLLQWAISYLNTNYQKGAQFNYHDYEQHNYRLEAEVLLAFVLGYTRTKLYVEAETKVAPDKVVEFTEGIKKRAGGYPLQYITGKQEFMSLEFKVQEGVLIPRSDTEILAEKAIAILQEKSAIATNNDHFLVADICTGSGAIGLSIAHYVANSKLILTDISETAVKVANINRVKLGLGQQAIILKGDLLKPVRKWAAANQEKDRLFDMIVSNPPYISDSGWGLVELGVKVYEPKLALAGGADGLVFYRPLVREAATLLKPGGYLLLEIGFDQGKAVTELFYQTNGYEEIQIMRDYGNRERVVLGRKRLK